jgi:hypothetical protein
MRHFLCAELVPLAIAIAGLPCGMEALGPARAPVGCARSTHRLATLQRPARQAVALPTVTPIAESKLDPTPPARDEPKLFRRHQAPCRRFLDIELPSVVKVESSDPVSEPQKAWSCSSGPSLFGGHIVYLASAGPAQLTIGERSTVNADAPVAALFTDPNRDGVISDTRFQGASGRELPRECYDVLVEKLVARGFDRAALPALETTPLGAGLIVEDESDVEEKLIVPLLERLGYVPDDWKRRIAVRFGRGERIYPDFVVGMHDDDAGPRCRLIVEAKFRLASRTAIVRDFRQAQSYALQLRASGIVLAAREGVWLWERTRDAFSFDEHTHWSWHELDDPTVFAKVALRIGQGETVRRPRGRRAR